MGLARTAQPTFCQPQPHLRRQFPGQEKQVLEYFRNNPQAVDGLRAPIFEEKVVDFVLELAKVADHLYVFQRTPNFSVPARNGPPHKDRYAEIAADIPAARAGLMRSRAAINGISMSPQPAASHSPEMQQQMLAEQWDKGGHGMAFLFADQGTKQ